ncbi:uncharacterized protein LDX57_011575 [Aspergillus melleus]|uniref:uncharacterized protein n=1 Tax=Aspergillus melleus TaxID=138277 RepID=UPI001E8D9D94|nr:uncharacterized protein LDX57_011575 [Aspergillus melleus]KAH8433939.1 hypothetical protein LDX57_011575 [Aspergillus melleus]
MAFLILCRHIFPNDGLRKVIYILMGIVLAYCVVYMVGLAFECLPVSYIWTQWTGETIGHCLNINAFGWSCAIWNIILDLAIMAVPLFGVRKLSLRRRKKILIMVMFGAGLL